MTPNTAGISRAPSSITSNVRLLAFGVLAAASIALIGSGSTHAQPADAPASIDADAVWTVVEDPLLFSRGHDFVGSGDVVGNEDAFLVSRFASCGNDCLQVLRSIDGLAWELIVIDSPGRAIRDLAATDHGFAALVVEGSQIYGPSPDSTWHAYRSDDGLVWSGYPIEPTRPGDVIHSIAAAPGRLAAVGCDTRIDRLGARARGEPFCRRAVVWSSTDGATWTREEPAPGRLVELASVAVVGDTIVASGVDFSAGRDEPGSPAVFTRSAAGPWTRTEPSGVERGLLAVQASPEHGFVLSSITDWALLSHGNIDFDAPLDERYASADGITWTALTEPRLAAATTDTESRLAALAESAGGTAIIATSRTPRTRGHARETSRLWRHDGETWRWHSLPAGGYAGDGGLRLAVGPEGRALLVNEAGTMLLSRRQATQADALAVGPVPGRVAVPPSPLGPSARMAYLSVNAVDQETCKRLRNRDRDASTRQAAAVLDCGVAGSEQRVRHFLFSTEADLDAWWSQTVERRERRGIEDADDAITACADGRAASGAWSTIEGSLSGQVACHRRRDGAVVMWTAPATLIGSEMRVDAGELGILMASFAQGREAVPADALDGSDELPGAVIPDPGPIDPGARRETERMLRSALRPIACKPWRQEDEPFMFGSHAAVRCAAPAPGVNQLALFAFDDPEELESYWTWRRGRISPLLDWAAACRDGREGTTDWEHGSAACFVKREGRGTAQIRWTDDRTDTYGVLDATSANLPALVFWWETNDPSSLAPTPVTPVEGLDGRLPTGTQGQLRYLRQRVDDPSRCQPMSPTALARTEPGAIAGLECAPTRRERMDYDDMSSIRYLLFPSARALNRWWDTSRAQAAPSGVDRDSGTLGMCTNFYGEHVVETGWITRDRSSSGRLLCAPRQDLRWTVSQDLVAGETDAGAWWFVRTYPDRVQRYRRLGPDERPHRPFAPPRTLKPLPRGIGDEPTEGETWAARPRSGSGLPVGVVHPVSLGHCDGLGFSPDVDGSFWQVTGGIDPNGKAVKRNLGYRHLGEGQIVEFLKIGKDRAQLRTESGYVFGYERHPGKRRFYPCA